jgi:hypothetical protein
VKRNLKDQGFVKFKTVEHPVSHRTADIKVNKRSGEFACEIGDMSKKGLLRDVEQWANGMLKKHEKTLLTWEPVIYAHVEGDRYGYSRRGRDDEDHERSVEVKVKAERFWIAKASRDPNGNEVWRKIHWIQGDDTDSGCIADEDRYSVSSIFREPREKSTYRDSSETPAKLKGWVRLPEVEGSWYLLAHTPELWAGIQHVIDTIENEEKILNRLFKTKEGQETLSKLGTQPELLRLTAGG